MAGISRKDSILSGLAIGALLYKPTDAFIFVLFLIARRDFRALLIVFGCGVAWYLTSVAATAGDWSWPLHYASIVSGYYRGDFGPNSSKAFSLPTVLMVLGTPLQLAIGVGLALAVTAAAIASRIRPLEGASMLPLAGLAASPHAWPYELAILIPTACWVWLNCPKPLREWILGISYLLAATWWLTVWKIGFDPLVIVVLGGTGFWIASVVHRCRSVAQTRCC